MANLFDYPELTSMHDDDLGYAVLSTDTPEDKRFKFGTLIRPRTGYVSVDALGAAGNGVADDSDAINEAISIASSLGLAVLLNSKIYGIGASLDGSYSNIKFICPSGGAKLLKLDSGGTSSIVANVAGRYKGWTFEGIEFDGNGVTSAGVTVVLSDTSDVRFNRCKFRRMNATLTVQASNRIYFYDCDIYGTRPGVMASGTYDPAAVSTAAYDPGIQVNGGSNRIVADNCRFHFCGGGAFIQNGTATMRTRGFTVKDCEFRGDYFNGPYCRLRFSITAYNSGTREATVGAGGLTGHFPTGASPNTVSIAVQKGSGSNLSSGNGGAWATTGSFGSIRIGDVIETSNGKRAEIFSFTDSQNIQLSEWESMDTYEPTSPPAANTSWRVMRYFAASAEIVDDTHLSFFFEPVHVFTGELITVGASDVATWNCRELPNIGYTGIHINYGSENTRIIGSWFRGGWGDQISIFHTEDARITDNTVEYGQDEGLTLTHCLRSIAKHNTFRYSGVSAISINQSDGSILEGNIIDSWGIVNRGFVGRGGIESEDDNPRLIIDGNSFSYNQTSGFGGQSPYMISLINGPCNGTKIKNNTGQFRTGELYMDASAGEVIANVAAFGSPSFNEDVTNAAGITIANNGTATPFSTTRNFSGLVVLSERLVTGHTAIIAAGSALFPIIGVSASGVFTNTINNAGTINIYNSGAGVLTIQNKTGSSINVIVYSIRTREI